MPSGRLRLAVGIVFAVVLLLSAAGVQYARERRYPAAFDEAEALYVTSGATVGRLSIGYQPLAADVYWIRAIQYYGENSRRAREMLRSPSASASASVPGRGSSSGSGVTASGSGMTPSGSGVTPSGSGVPAPSFDLLYPMLDITTTLDPRFNIAYRFGSIFLAENYPTGAGRPDLAIKLLEKGLRAQPDRWEYMQDIGFVNYWWGHDYTQAAQWFNRAADLPGAPWFLRSLAATTAAVGGDRRSSRTMWQSIRQSADNEWLRNESERRLLQLDAMDGIEDLQRRVDRYTAEHGAPPRDWSELLGRRGTIGDPTGTPLQLRDGRVSLSESSRLWPLPDEPGGRGAP